MINLKTLLNLQFLATTQNPFSRRREIRFSFVKKRKWYPSWNGGFPRNALIRRPSKATFGVLIRRNPSFFSILFTSLRSLFAFGMCSITSSISAPSYRPDSISESPILRSTKCASNQSSFARLTFFKFPSVNTTSAPRSLKIRENSAAPPPILIIFLF